MRKLFKEFYHIPEQGKICEKTIVTRLVLTITIIIVCLMGMTFTAYAYFSCNVSSDLNVIKSANFEMNVSVEIADSKGKNLNSEVKPITSDYQKFKLSDLKVGEWYTVTITPNEKSTVKTGFALITATNCKETYHTQQLGVDANMPGGVTSEIKFMLMVTDVTDVILEAHWGTSSYYPELENANLERYITYQNSEMEKIKMVIGEHTEPNLHKSNVSTPKSVTTSTNKSTTSIANKTTTSATSEPATSTNTTVSTNSSETQSTDEMEDDVTGTPASTEQTDSDSTTTESDN